MNQIKQLTTNIGITGYKTIPDPRNIDLIAEAIEAFGQCVITFNSNGDEWQVTPVFLGTPVTFGHAICAVDYTLVGGVKTLVCEDSAGQWSSADGLRLITQDFLSHRASGALYFLGAKDVSVPQDPQFIFNRDMSYGETSADVEELQKRLGVIQTGYYGDLTRQAVYKYQLANVSLSWWEKWILIGRKVGQKTRDALNK